MSVLSSSSSSSVLDFLELLDIDALQACKDVINHKDNMETIAMIDGVIRYRENSQREMDSEHV